MCNPAVRVPSGDMRGTLVSTETASEEHGASVRPPETARSAIVNARHTGPVARRRHGTGIESVMRAQKMQEAIPGVE